jgi:XRE family aerobic/anaerobic benzoate catabolism transcriptional regulator
MLDARESLYRLTNATLDTSGLSVDEALQQLVAWVHPVAAIS